jgi:hypothetical protein
MPLRDHFRPPLDDLTSWEGFHGQWPAMIAQTLARKLPRRYVAAPRVHSGSSIEIDVATYEQDAAEVSSADANNGNGGAVATAVWAPLLQHPNIVQIHEVGEHNGLPYFSLEFCPGGSLADKLDGTPLPAGEAARLVQTLAVAMQAAHDKGILHRDLKPANVLLSEDGTSKITDFGLAKKLGEQGQTPSMAQRTKGSVAAAFLLSWFMRSPCCG